VIDEELLHYTLQRQALLRQDPAAQTALRARADARVIALVEDALSLVGTSPYRPLLGLDPVARERAIFLGLYDELPTFAVLLESAEQGGFAAADFGDLRQHAARLSATDLLIACQAKALLHWHREHRFCAGCGAVTTVVEAGHSRHCSACGRNHFPRTDPAIIVAIRHHNKLLFARGTGWPAGRYGMIAGFVEPGESMEQAVAREVMEETGLRISAVPTYAFSQPWPSPSSLMIAYFADSQGDVLELKDRELEHAQWLSREALIAAVKAGTMKLPTRASAAYVLVRAWFEESGTALSDALVQ